jgi:hypothetical protein
MSGKFFEETTAALATIYTIVMLAILASIIFLG